MPKGRVTFLVSAKNAVGRGLKKALGAVRGFAGGIARVGKKAGLALAGMGAGLLATAKKAQDFNKAIAQSATLADINMGAAKKQVRSLSAEFGLAKDELANGLYQALSAGVPKDNVFEFLRSASKGAVAGAGSVAEAVDLATTTLNAWGMEASDVDRVMDVLFTGIKKGKTTLSELAGSMSEVAQVATANKISMEEVTGAFASLTKQGVPTSKAATQIRAAILSMNDVLGDGWSKTMTLTEGMEAVRKESGGSQTALRQLMGRVEGMNAVLGLTGDKANMAAEDLSSMRESAGAADKAFKTVAEENPIDRFLQTVSNLILTVGENVLSRLVGPMEKAQVAIEVLTNSGLIELWAEKVKLVIKGIWPVLKGLGKGIAWVGKKIGDEAAYWGARSAGSTKGEAWNIAKNQRKQEERMHQEAMDEIKERMNAKKDELRQSREGGDEDKTGDTKRKRQQELEDLKKVGQKRKDLIGWIRKQAKETRKLEDGSGDFAGMAGTIDELAKKAEGVATWGGTDLSGIGPIAKQAQAIQERGNQLGKERGMMEKIAKLEERRVELAGDMQKQQNRQNKLAAIDLQIANARARADRAMFRNRPANFQERVEGFMGRRQEAQEAGKENQEFKDKLDEMANKDARANRLGHAALIQDKLTKEERKMLDQARAARAGMRKEAREEARIRQLQRMRDRVQDDQLIELQAIRRQQQRLLQFGGQ